MLIGIDASRAVREKRTGTENYSWEIIRAILALDQKNHYRLYAPHLPNPNFGVYPNIEWKILPASRLWSQSKLSHEINKNPPNVLFVPSHVVPLLGRVPSVVTIHGLEYVYSPQSYGRRQRAYLKFSTSVSVSKAKKVIAPSTRTKNDIVKYYKCPADKIVVIHEASDRTIYNPAVDFGDRPIIEPYIFSLGRLEERKNQRLLVEAFSLLTKEKLNVKLVLAGQPGYGYDKIETAIKRLPTTLQTSVIQLGYITDQEVARYLKHAAVFAFPSLYEGFGIPILEAMSVGTPVVASNAACLSEVAGEAAVLLPPANPLSWAAAMSRIIHQPHYAEILRQKGFTQAAKFSWKTAAEQTLKVLEDAVGK